MFLCFIINIAILRIFFSNTKWIWMSLETLFMELYFIYKKLFGLFSRNAGISWTRKINASYILSFSAKSYWCYTLSFFKRTSKFCLRLAFFIFEAKMFLICSYFPKWTLQCHKEVCQTEYNKNTLLDFFSFFFFQAAHISSHCEVFCKKSVLQLC